MYANNSTLITFIEMRKQFNQQIEKEWVRKSPAAIYPVRIWEILFTFLLSFFNTMLKR